MLVILLSLMGYHLWGENVHEILGATFLATLLLHSSLNLHWFKNLKQGEYSAFRILQIIINLLLILVFMTAIISGLMLSQHLLPNLIIHNSSDLVRKTHMLSVHWGQVLIALHLGMHWKMLANFFCKIWHVSPDSLLAKRFMPVIFTMASIYGVYVFMQRNLFSYLFMQVDFSFFDFDESKLLFYADFLTITIFMANMTQCLVWFFLKCIGQIR